MLRTRAPGMSLDKLPMFAWTMLIFAGMIVFAFPAVILATMLLELERAFGWPFFIAAKGGDPLLWQHLFWFFGHPEVYIIFLPAAGMVSMIVPTMARTPLVAYNLIVVALIATGFFSFGLWVHHMFTTGIPDAVAQLLLGGQHGGVAAERHPGVRLDRHHRRPAGCGSPTPSLFVLGFLFIFTLGGLTGVMVAMVPFDWQAHDTYFVVAHFHYVLVGGMVFPLFAAFYYWAPAFSRRALSERLGTLGVLADVRRLQRRLLPDAHRPVSSACRGASTPIRTELGWDTLNLISTVGAFMFAAGVLVFLVDLVRNLRPSLVGPRRQSSGEPARSNGCPTIRYGLRSIPAVSSREPLWDQPGLREDGRGRALLSARQRRPAAAKPSSPRRSRRCRNISCGCRARAGRRSSPRSSRPRSSCC